MVCVCPRVLVYVYPLTRTRMYILYIQQLFSMYTRSSPLKRRMNMSSDSRFCLLFCHPSTCRLFSCFRFFHVCCLFSLSFPVQQQYYDTVSCIIYYAVPGIPAPVNCEQPELGCRFSIGCFLFIYPYVCTWYIFIMTFTFQLNS